MNISHASLLLPVLMPLVTAVGCVVAGRRLGLQRVIGTGGAAAHVCVAIVLIVGVSNHDILTTSLGGWPAPFGIAFAADRLAAAMVLMVALIGMLGSLFVIPTIRDADRLTHFMRLLHLMLAGCCGLFLTADLFNFYVWLELILITSFGLMAFGRGRRQIEATAKYLALNILGSMLLLSAIGLLYARTGTLNMADLALHLDADPEPDFITAIGMLTLVALCIKSAVFPLFFWLPASYHAPPIAVTAIFGGLLTKVGVYGLIRMFTLLFVQQTEFTHGVILVLGSLTMITGVLGAVAQRDLRRLLSFHIVSQIGYMLIGLGFYTTFGVAAAIFFMLHIIITKTALFFVCGVVQRVGGSLELDRLGGLYRSRPGVSLLFILPALSLGGIPPLSGFVGKLSLIQAGISEARYAVVAIAVCVSLLTLYSMVKVWTHAFWEPEPRDAPPPHPDDEEDLPAPLTGPTIALVVLVVAMGLGAGPVLDYTTDAAVWLMDRDAYIHAVLDIDRATP